MSAAQPRPDSASAKAAKFVGVGLNVMRGQEFVARARSVSMARWIARAMNSFDPGPRFATGSERRS